MARSRPAWSPSGSHRGWSPSISPDGRFLFFTSSRPALTQGRSPVPLRYADLRRMASEPGNGSPDIWWVDAQLVENLRPSGW